jgi:hypothetical protein
MKITDLREAIGSKNIAKIQQNLNGPLIALTLFSVFNSCQINSIKGNTDQAIRAYTTAPVLVQVAPDGKPITAQRIASGYLSKLNVQRFIEEIIVPLYRYDRNLPAELGGKPDPGVKIPEIEDRVSTLQWFASQAFVAPESRIDWFKEHLAGRPESWENGVRSGLVNLSLDPIQKSNNGDNYRVVVVHATKIVEDKNGQLISRGPWSREIEVKATTIFKPLIKPTRLEQKFSLATRRGLQILSIRPAPNK